MPSDDNDPMSPPLSAEEEAVMKQELEAALAAYEGIAPPSLLELMRETAEEAARSHPAARRLLAAAAARPAPDVSGDLPKGRPKSGDGRAGGGPR
jgi:hypothetical protein